MNIKSPNSNEDLDLGFLNEVSFPLKRPLDVTLDATFRCLVEEVVHLLPEILGFLPGSIPGGYYTDIHFKLISPKFYASNARQSAGI